MDLLLSLLGGALIGLSAASLMFFKGKIAGISGIVGGGLSSTARGDAIWRVAFIGGLVLGGLAVFALLPATFAFTVDRSLWAVAIAGLLVGVGTRLGNGCTSGHGVCGVSRFSPRSILATVTFIFTGGVAVFVTNQLFGGSL